MQPRRIVSVLAVLGAIAVLGVPPAAANHHRLRIAEVLGGIPGRENAQFVELQMFTAGQEVVHDASLAFIDATGGTLAAPVFPADVADESDNATVLAMTPQAASFFGITPDMTYTAVDNRTGGRIDYLGRPGSTSEGILDAFSWGSYSGDATGVGTPFNAASGLALGVSAHRDLSRGASSTEMDTADDTGDSAADFVSGPPTPRNNAGQTTGRATIVSRLGSGVIEVDAAEGVTNLVGIQGNTRTGWRIVDTAAPVHLDPSATATCVNVNVIEVRCDATSPAAITIRVLDKHDRVRVRGRIAATVFGGVGSDRLIGNAAADALHGEAGRDTITGGKAADTVFAGDGDDTVLVKGDGAADEVDCGADDDTISFDEGLDVFAADGPGACETPNP